MSLRRSLGRSLGSPRKIVAMLIAAVVAIAVGIAGLLVAHDNNVAHPSDDDRVAVQQDAADAVAALMTFTPTDAPVKPNVLTRLTGPLARSYRTQGPDVVLPNAVDSKTSMTAKIIGAAVNHYTYDRARVLVYVDQEVSVPGLTTGAQRVAISRWAVMNKVDGRWVLGELAAVVGGY